MFESVFVRPDEARDFVFSVILELVRKYEAGAITYADLFFRIKNEPVLTEEEKRSLLSSPTRATVMKLWRGEETFVVDGIAVDKETVVVVARMAEAADVVKRNPFLFVPRKGVQPGSVVTVYRVLSAIARGDDVRKVFIVRPEAFSHCVLSAFVMVARIAGIVVSSTKPVMLRPELDMVMSGMGRLRAMIREANISVILEPCVPTRPFLHAVVRKIVEDRGKASEFKAMFGIDPKKDLIWRDDWWRYFEFEEYFDGRIYKMAIDEGYPEDVAKRIAKRRVTTMNDVIALAKELIAIMPEWEEKHIEFIAKVYDVRLEILKNVISYLT